MPQFLAHATLLVRDYDQAIQWYTTRLGFEVVRNESLTPEKRWVTIAPPGGQTSLLLAKAATPHQQNLIGQQSAGRVFLFLQTDNFESEHAALLSRGVHFIEPPRHESYGT